MCKRKNTDRQTLKKMTKFLNDNRNWLCLENCIVAPECQYCKLIYQINYSCKNNPTTCMTTFRNSVFGRTFSFLEEVYKQHLDSGKWLNYNRSFKKTFFGGRRKNIFTVSFI